MLSILKIMNKEVFNQVDLLFYYFFWISHQNDEKVLSELSSDIRILVSDFFMNLGNQPMQI